MTPTRGEEKYTGTSVGDKSVTSCHVKRVDPSNRAYEKLGVHNHTNTQLVNIKSTTLFDKTQENDNVVGAVISPLALCPTH